MQNDGSEPNLDEIEGDAMREVDLISDTAWMSMRTKH